MADRRIVLVTGATGAQGGSVARHLLALGQYTVRCLTRHPESEKASALRAAGAQVVGGDLDNVPSLVAALRGVWGVFGVTNFWEHFDKERQQGTNLIDAVSQAGVRYFVYSSLPPAGRISGLRVPHFDIKADLEAEARRRNLPCAFTHVAFYYENFIAFLPPRKQPDGSYLVSFPQGDTRLAAVGVEDVGGVVAPMFARPSDFLGRTIGIVGDDRPPADYAAIMSRTLGVTVRYQHMPREQFAALGFPGADDLANMFDFNRLHLPNRRADLELSRQLYPAMQSFEVWAAANRQRLAQALGL
jgi:uncharacterized protein YbjT (DUF2867 family)